jgi:16S rRNA (guanine966-N2)-methyltransferase
MRVTGGVLGGRRLRAPRGEATRPTADKVRQALFNVLGDVSGLSVADLYAGSGALAIEALSRGAAHAVCVERAPTAAAVLRDNLRDLALTGRATLLSLPVERAAPALLERGPYDLVLCDPPWTELDRAIATLGRLPWAELLAAGGHLLLEHPARGPEPKLAPLTATSCRNWGDTAVTWWERDAPR